MSLFPKVYSPLANWPWLRISPHTSLNVICCLTITAWQWLMSFTCVPVQTEPNKSPLRKRFLVLLLWEIGHLSSQADHVLVDLFSSAVDGGLCGQSSPANGNTIHLLDQAKHPGSYTLFLFFHIYSITNNQQILSALLLKYIPNSSTSQLF